MANYTIYRTMGNNALATHHLNDYIKAFKTLYCGGYMNNIGIYIYGRWNNYKKDGLFLDYTAGKIVDIRSKYVEIMINENTTPEICTVELCPVGDEGFSRILLITEMNR